MSAGLFFDLDGTIMDAEGRFHDILSQVLVEFDIKLTDEVREALVGKTYEQLVIALRSAGHTTFNADEFVARIQAQFYSNDVPFAAYPDMLAVVERLPADTLRALVTSAPDKGVSRYSEDIKILQTFPVVVTQDSVTRHKPEPDPYLLARKLLGGIGGVAIEDTRNGLLAAKGAGLFALGVPRAHNGFGAHLTDVADAILSVDDSTRWYDEIMGHLAAIS